MTNPPPTDLMSFPEDLEDQTLQVTITSITAPSRMLDVRMPDSYVEYHEKQERELQEFLNPQDIEVVRAALNALPRKPLDDE